MAELDEKLSAILGNPEAMGQIMNIAKALSGGSGETSGSPPQATDAEFVPVERAEGAGSGASPMDFADNPLAVLGELNPRLLQTALRLFSEYRTTDDHKVALLAALKPFLKEERLAKMDKAVQIAKLSRVIRVAFQMFKGGEADGDV